ncbi:ArnT family glycosyltransferase [Micromonospora sp. CA-244673]|uniref:ArnT family glycosyltransferase n=1 Tax=Micromonospora sp. CA-244673 TaxID=3239958 RepID=UPI003D911658
MTTEQSDATGGRADSAPQPATGDTASDAKPGTTARRRARKKGARAGAAPDGTGTTEPAPGDGPAPAAEAGRGGDRAESAAATASSGDKADRDAAEAAAADGAARADGKATTDNKTDGRATTGGKTDGKATTDDKTDGKATTDDKTGSGDKAETGKVGTDKSGTDKTGTGRQAGTGTAETAKAGDKPADPWTAFGPAPDPVLTRPRRIVRAVGRFLVHEWTLAAVASLALAALMTWPTLRYPRYTLPQDYWDPSLQSWQLAWSGHILLTDPAQLWNSNTFFPESWSFAFSDTLLGYAPAGMIGVGPEDALLRYNILFVLAHALATFGAYALARQLGAGRIAGAVAGASYAYAPWLLAQAGHLHIISNGGIPLALAMLARGHGWSLRHGYRPRRRHAGWAFAGWLVAAWQLSLGFGIGLPFAYLLAGIVLVAAAVWFARRRWVKHPFGWRLFLADLLGGLVFAAVGALLAVPYFTVSELHPNAARTLGEIQLYSPPASGFFTAPAESRVWGELHEGARAVLPWHPEMTLLPGFALYALAAGGLFFSVWRVRHRLFLLAGVLLTMALGMGTRFFGGRFTYVPLFEHLPGWNGLRTPGRMMLWTTLLLGLLAAGAVTAFCARVRELAAERVPPWPGPWLRLATLVPLLLVVVEGLNVTPHPVVPRQPAVMRTVDGPMLVLPSSQNLDQPVMLWSTDRFQRMVNGGSGFTPNSQAQVRDATVSFPDFGSVDYLRRLGVKNVVVLRDRLGGTPWEGMLDRPVDGLGVTREEVGDAVVYRL